MCVFIGVVRTPECVIGNEVCSLNTFPAEDLNSLTNDQLREKYKIGVVECPVITVTSLVDNLLTHHKIVRREAIRGKVLLLYMYFFCLVTGF